MSEPLTGPDRPNDGPPVEPAPVPATRRRGHRRAVAPPTCPTAEQAEDLPSPAGLDVPGGSAASPTEKDPPDTRDAWIRAQRPPHWD